MTHYFGDNQDYTLDSWSVKNIHLDFLDVFSNGDLIAYIGIEDKIVSSNQFASSINNFLTRIDQQTGKIVWAYANFFSDFGNQVSPFNLAIKNDTIWIIGYIHNFVLNIYDTKVYKKVLEVKQMNMKSLINNSQRN